MENSEIAKIFREIADYLELEDVQFKPRAYRKAAQALETLPLNVASYEKEGRKLEDISGIGKSIADKIRELLKTGKLKDYERLKKKLPVDMGGLTAIEGVGPKMVEKFYKKLKVRTVEDLERVARKGKIQELPGFREKTEKNILDSIKILKAREKRFLLGYILYQVKDILDKVKAIKEIKKAEVAGSIRRMKETIGDVDILATATNPKEAMEKFTHFKEIKKVLAKGPTKSSIRLANGLDVDLRIVPEKSYGAALQYFTGNKAHNIVLRAIAKKRGYKLSEYGVFNKKGKQVAGRTEEEVYKKLGLPLIPPELRTASGEIEAAQKGKLPKVVGYSDIQGDLHMHTKWSDGANTISEMALGARERGLKYIAITDHTGHLKIAGALTKRDFKKQFKEIEKINKRIKGIKILKGAEIDIKDNGELDFDNKDILKELDIVIASVHSNFKMPKKKMTARVIKAIKNPYVNILGHPMGRMIQKREPVEIDLKRVFKEAKKNQVALEINAFPERLDLKDIYIREAIKNGVKLAINTDAHSLDHLRFLELGVGQARRGWAKKKDIINTLPFNKLSGILKKQ